MVVGFLSSEGSTGRVAPVVQTASSICVEVPQDDQAGEDRVQIHRRWAGSVGPCMPFGGVSGCNTACLAPRNAVAHPDVRGGRLALRHPARNRSRLVDSWLFAFYDTAFSTMPHDRRAWAESRRSLVWWVVEAVQGPAVVGPARGPKRPTCRGGVVNAVERDSHASCLCVSANRAAATALESVHVAHKIG